jgi:phospholipid/cholesterol/gamma-HCH transport system substrate-binding protein
MKNRNLVVGLFVAAGLTLFTVGLSLIGNRHQAFARHIEFYAEFRDLSGLANGAKVQVAGMDAGQVLDVGIPDSPSAKFRVKLRVDEKFHGLIRTDSLATIGTEGVVGGTFLEIRAGSSNAQAAAAGETIPSKEPTDLADLLDQGRGTLADVDATVKNANGLLTTVGGKVDSTLDQVKGTVSNVNDVVVGLKEGRGSVGMFLRDEALENQVRQTVINAQKASVDLRHVSSQADGLVSDIQSRNFPQKIDSTMASVKSAASNIDASAQQLHQTITEFAGPDEQGVTAGVNIRQSLSNANAATSNMADETEALKHNFFFRGFFQHRGYYNLTHMSPDKYRKNVLATNPGNYRIWLSAEQLFQGEPGPEQLTPQGKDLLSSALAQYGDSVEESPIVVEGYWGGINPADQLLLSRSRAILVRHYLQNHFQLDPAHLGAIPMKNHPPDGLDRSSWDGVCIVVLRHESHNSRQQK